MPSNKIIRDFKEPIPEDHICPLCNLDNKDCECLKYNCKCDNLAINCQWPDCICNNCLQISKNCECNNE